MTGNHISSDLLHSGDFVIKTSHVEHSKERIIRQEPQGKHHSTETKSPANVMVQEDQ